MVPITGSRSSCDTCIQGSMNVFGGTINYSYITIIISLLWLAVLERYNKKIQCSCGECSYAHADAFRPQYYCATCYVTIAVASSSSQKLPPLPHIEKYDDIPV